MQVLVFLLGLSVIFYLTKNYWEGWLIGAFSILITLSGIFIGLVISLENRHPSKTMTWLIVLGTFPLFGFIFYLIFGRNYRKKKLFKQKALLDDQAFSKIEGHKSLNESDLAQMGGHQQLLFRLAHRIGQSPISFSTETEVLTDGDQTFNKIKEEIREAKAHIHLEYYIVRNDDIGNEIKDILIEKATAGVEVRFLYDGVGSWRLDDRYISEMRQAGIEMLPFSPVKLPLMNNRLNFRNHRKIIVIDGNKAFVGGLNIGDEYLGRNQYFGFWRDTHLFVRGEAVRTLQLIFLQDWYYMTGEPLLTPYYLSPDLIEQDNLGGVQMIAGGPDHEWEVIKHLFFSMIVSAKKAIWITTPYFIPDEDFLTALKVAALSGIDVRLLVPSRPDKRIVFYASRSYFSDLLETGVKIFEYEKGFLHSKIIIVDYELASIGTSNMDMRSFHLNFEVNAFLYRTESTKSLVEDYLNDLNYSSEIILQNFKRRSLWERIKESGSRLLSPLL